MSAKDNLSIKNKRLIMSFSLRDRWRKWFNFLMIGHLFFLSLLAAIPFLFIVYYVLEKGVSAINWDFLTQLPTSPGEKGGGMSNALIGSAIVVGMASFIGVPYGMGIGVYLNE